METEKPTNHISPTNPHVGRSTSPTLLKRIKSIRKLKIFRSHKESGSSKQTQNPGRAQSLDLNWAQDRTKDTTGKKPSRISRYTTSVESQTHGTDEKLSNPQPTANDKQYAQQVSKKSVSQSFLAPILLAKNKPQKSSPGAYVPTEGSKYLLSSHPSAPQLALVSTVESTTSMECENTTLSFSFGAVSAIQNHSDQSFRDIQTETGQIDSTKSMQYTDGQLVQSTGVDGQIESPLGDGISTNMAVTWKQPKPKLNLRSLNLPSHKLTEVLQGQNDIEVTSSVPDTPPKSGELTQTCSSDVAKESRVDGKSEYVQQQDKGQSREDKKGNSSKDVDVKTQSQRESDCRRGSIAEMEQQFEENCDLSQLVGKDVDVVEGTYGLSRTEKQSGDTLKSIQVGVASVDPQTHVHGDVNNMQVEVEMEHFTSAKLDRVQRSSTFQSMAVEGYFIKQRDESLSGARQQLTQVKSVNRQPPQNAPLLACSSKGTVGNIVSYQRDQSDPQMTMFEMDANSKLRKEISQQNGHNLIRHSHQSDSSCSKAMQEKKIDGYKQSGNWVPTDQCVLRSVRGRVAINGSFSEAAVRSCVSTKFRLKHKSSSYQVCPLLVARVQQMKTSSMRAQLRQYSTKYLRSSIQRSNLASVLQLLAKQCMTKKKLQNFLMLRLYGSLQKNRRSKLLKDIRKRVLQGDLQVVRLIGLFFNLWWLRNMSRRKLMFAGPSLATMAKSVEQRGQALTQNALKGTEAAPGILVYFNAKDLQYMSENTIEALQELKNVSLMNQRQLNDTQLIGSEHVLCQGLECPTSKSEIGNDAGYHLTKTPILSSPTIESTVAVVNNCEDSVSQSHCVLKNDSFRCRPDLNYLPLSPKECSNIDFATKCQQQRACSVMNMHQDQSQELDPAAGNSCLKDSGASSVSDIQPNSAVYKNVKQKDECKTSEQNQISSCYITGGLQHEDQSLESARHEQPSKLRVVGVNVSRSKDNRCGPLEPIEVEAGENRNAQQYLMGVFQAPLTTSQEEEAQQALPHDLSEIQAVSPAELQTHSAFNTLSKCKTITQVNVNVDSTVKQVHAYIRTTDCSESLKAQVHQENKKCSLDGDFLHCKSKPNSSFGNNPGQVPKNGAQCIEMGTSVQQHTQDQNSFVGEKQSDSLVLCSDVKGGEMPHNMVDQSNSDAQTRSQGSLVNSSTNKVANSHVGRPSSSKQIPKDAKFQHKSQVNTLGMSLVKSVGQQMALKQSGGQDTSQNSSLEEVQKLYHKATENYQFSKQMKVFERSQKKEMSKRKCSHWLVQNNIDEYEPKVPAQMSTVQQNKAQTWLSVDANKSTTSRESMLEGTLSPRYIPERYQRLVQSVSDIRQHRKSLQVQCGIAQGSSSSNSQQQCGTVLNISATSECIRDSLCCNTNKNKGIAMQEGQKISKNEQQSGQAPKSQGYPKKMNKRTDLAQSCPATRQESHGHICSSQTNRRGRHSEHEASQYRQMAGKYIKHSKGKFQKSVSAPHEDTTDTSNSKSQTDIPTLKSQQNIAEKEGKQKQGVQNQTGSARGPQIGEKDCLRSSTQMRKSVHPTTASRQGKSTLVEKQRKISSKSRSKSQGKTQVQQKISVASQSLTKSQHTALQQLLQQPESSARIHSAVFQQYQHSQKVQTRQNKKANQITIQDQSIHSDTSNQGKQQQQRKTLGSDLAGVRKPGQIVSEDSDLLHQNMESNSIPQRAQQSTYMGKYLSYKTSSQHSTQPQSVYIQNPASKSSDTRKPPPIRLGQQLQLKEQQSAQLLKSQDESYQRLLKSRMSEISRSKTEAEAQRRSERQADVLRRSLHKEADRKMKSLLASYDKLENFEIWHGNQQEQKTSPACNVANSVSKVLTEALHRKLNQTYLADAPNTIDMNKPSSSSKNRTATFDLSPGQIKEPAPSSQAKLASEYGSNLISPQGHTSIPVGSKLSTYQSPRSTCKTVFSSSFTTVHDKFAKSRLKQEVAGSSVQSPTVIVPYSSVVARKKQLNLEVNTTSESEEVVNDKVLSDLKSNLSKNLMSLQNSVQTLALTINLSDGEKQRLANISNGNMLRRSNQPGGLHGKVLRQPKIRY